MDRYSIFIVHRFPVSKIAYWIELLVILKSILRMFLFFQVFFYHMHKVEKKLSSLMSVFITDMQQDYSLLLPFHLTHCKQTLYGYLVSWVFAFLCFLLWILLVEMVCHGSQLHVPQKPHAFRGGRFAIECIMAVWPGFIHWLVYHDGFTEEVRLNLDMCSTFDGIHGKAEERLCFQSAVKEAVFPARLLCHISLLWNQLTMDSKFYRLWDKINFFPFNLCVSSTLCKQQESTRTLPKHHPEAWDS